MDLLCDTEVIPLLKPHLLRLQIVKMRVDSFKHAAALIEIAVETWI